MAPGQAALGVVQVVLRHIQLELRQVVGQVVVDPVARIVDQKDQAFNVRRWPTARHQLLAGSCWIRRLTDDAKARALIAAPLLVCTVDHLTPATESLRGGRQIAPMLRLMTGDLVLDEPDDFDMADLPALTRLVHWAGMLGSRVLLSSATLPPALVQVGEDEVLFDNAPWYNEAATRAGSHSELEIYLKRWHVFQAHAGLMQSADEALARQAAFLQKCWKR